LVNAYTHAQLVQAALIPQYALLVVPDAAYQPSHHALQAISTQLNGTCNQRLLLHIEWWLGQQL